MRIRHGVSAVLPVRRGISGLHRQWRQVVATARSAGEAGASTAEYAMTTLAACGFAGVLLVILRSSPVKSMLLGIIQKALSLA